MMENYWEGCLGIHYQDTLDCLADASLYGRCADCMLIFPCFQNILSFYCQKTQKRYLKTVGAYSKDWTFRAYLGLSDLHRVRLLLHNKFEDCWRFLWTYNWPRVRHSNFTFISLEDSKTNSLRDFMYLDSISERFCVEVWRLCFWEPHSLSRQQR